ncbi:CbtB-domain containing protein [Chelatococcus sp. SYSU_G07232]|uniref:CbtB-domain containing protein n=1 Tax=Chelatococcus albus TaxID=3047466 RepID=A0ABT7AIC1_9HYPH|nr:CbtB-domain containing protein [Chelatococcus sp. SYSU_G07232]MDJ1158830.1 CbtB-domain containing protein [Chelatococcus sp. SYSU_G07232]
MTGLSIAGAKTASARTRAEALRVALVAFFIGAALVFVSGFAHPEAIHNAAHDTRHALSYPCH